MKGFFIGLIVLALLGWFFLPSGSAAPVGKLNVWAEPRQTETSARPFQFKGYTLTPVADFDVSARVLSKSIYRLGREADLAPVDLALGWQKMSDPAVLRKIDISQSNRFYHWYASDFSTPRHDIETMSANMHLIPANDTIDSQLRGVDKNSHIRLIGHLVDIRTTDGWHWNSSRTRGDTGQGACEVIYVTQVLRGS